MLSKEIDLAVLSSSIDAYLDGYTSDQLTELFYSGRMDRMYDIAELNKGNAPFSEKYRLVKNN